MPKTCSIFVNVLCGLGKKYLILLFDLWYLCLFFLPHPWLFLIEGGESTWSIFLQWQLKDYLFSSAILWSFLSRHMYVLNGHIFSSYYSFYAYIMSIICLLWFFCLKFLLCKILILLVQFSFFHNYLVYIFTYFYVSLLYFVIHVFFVDNILLYLFLSSLWAYLMLVI